MNGVTAPGTARGEASREAKLTIPAAAAAPAARSVLPLAAICEIIRANTQEIVAHSGEAQGLVAKVLAGDATQIEAGAAAAGGTRSGKKAQQAVAAMVRAPAAEEDRSAIEADDN